MAFLPNAAGRRQPAYLSDQFNRFLFAPISADDYGQPLSVVSAMARLDLDPWAEAASLSRMPGDKAVQKLASMIASLPNLPAARQEARKIATRLVALLPAEGLQVVNSGIIPTGNIHTAQIGFVIMAAVALLLALQLSMHSHSPADPAAAAPPAQTLTPR